MDRLCWGKDRLDRKARARLWRSLKDVLGFLGGSEIKKKKILLPVQETASTPGSGNDNPLQYSCLEIPWTEESSRPQSMGSRKSRTQLSD